MSEGPCCALPPRAQKLCLTSLATRRRREQLQRSNELNQQGQRSLGELKHEFEELTRDFAEGHFLSLLHPDTQQPRSSPEAQGSPAKWAPTALACPRKAANAPAGSQRLFRQQCMTASWHCRASIAKCCGQRPTRNVVRKVRPRKLSIWLRPCSTELLSRAQEFPDQLNFVQAV